MVIKTLYYAMTIFIAITLFLLIQDPYFAQLAKNDSQIATIEMKKVKDYEIDSKIVRISTASKAMRFKNEDKLDNVNMLQKKDGYIYSVSSDFATLKNSIATLKDNVLVVRSDGATVTTSKATYDTQKKILSGDEPFVLHEAKTNIKGEKFSYDMNKKTINIDKVKAIYQMEKR